MGNEGRKIKWRTAQFPRNTPNDGSPDNGGQTVQHTRLTSIGSNTRNIFLLYRKKCLS
jgi:hypothetical protein